MSPTGLCRRGITLPPRQRRLPAALKGRLSPNHTPTPTRGL